MARYRGSVCRLCRREGQKLFLKGDRCYSDKCAVERRGFPPGQHGQRRGKVSDYGLQLREKQKVKRMYGLMESQFRLTYKRAAHMKGVTGHNLLFLLETRLDNVAYRLGFANSRNQARQLVRHGHVMINGRRTNIPSARVKVGDVVAIREQSRESEQIQIAMEAAARRTVPSWLELEAKEFKGEVKALPTREELTMPMQEQLIVELYSR
ncbi:30S ribosomal protein S4 [Dethiosulfatarculus sandiegensis]|uniref:Small ribosomal subunit protein uS4 n=1 Tax=Dethiosulfatarculus sandiegensis TaxID=1429043 RepID=A0A0D2JCV2_9BACT|nr:30S ribosomal protein S4 [Dethiosulfatarculus sandiegensis]KIX15979.1 30S ribosomal protein S4 [Dethiosulfatarculus sandiegensis]